MTFKEERIIKEELVTRIIGEYNRLFQKENISTTRDNAIIETINTVFTYLREKDLLK